ncbi:MAG: peptide deformylase [bacterium]|nr:peptide deformylase [bacterium]
MNILRIVTLADKKPILHQPTQEVKNIGDQKIQRLIDEMIPTMYYKDGIGLAATQVNVGLRIATLVPNPEKFEDYKKKAQEAIIIINPKIIQHSLRTVSEEEGCLSVPGIFGPVKRWKSVTVEFYDREGKKNKMKASGLLARVFQHEIDHLDGTLYVQKALRLYKIELAH